MGEHCDSLAIVVPWCDRPDFEHTIEGFASTAAKLDAEILIVNFGGDELSLERIVKPFPSVNVYSVGCTKFFNKASANNIGIALSRSDIVFVSDCDIVIESDVVDELKAKVQSLEGCFGTIAGVVESDANARGGDNITSFGYTLRITLRNGRSLEIVDNEEDALTGARQAPGLLMARKADLVALDGYNGSFDGWGWEDQDMISRLTLGLGRMRVQSGILTHRSHGDDLRVCRYEQQLSSRWESRDRIFRRALGNYDKAKFSGTLARDWERFGNGIEQLK